MLKRLGLCLLAITMTANYALANAPALDPKQLLYGPDPGNPRFQSKPASELMTPTEHNAYSQALQQLNCTTAEKTLNDAFVRTYPQFQRARIQTDCDADRDCRYWTIYANATFHELGYCRAVLELRETEKELRRQKLGRPKFALKPFPQETDYSTPVIRRRDEAIALLISQAELNYAPALLELAQLIERTDIFAAGKEAEYILRRRACRVENNCTQKNPRLNALHNQISSDQLALVESMARTSGKRNISLHELLLGTVKE